jgi:hypothetical protein
MLKIDRENQSLAPLEQPTLSEASVRERYDLQEFICNSPDVFFAEMGQELFLIGSELQPSDTVQDRIDILAIDKDGTVVVIELKRGNHKLQLLQAISYAAMVADWTAGKFLELLNPSQRDALEDFLSVELEDVNRQQRIVLVAEAFDIALLKAAEWLSEQFGVDIRCCRISLARDSSDGREYLVCANVYPAPELVEQAVARRRSSSPTGDTKWSSWEEALQNVANEHVATFFRNQVADAREDYLPKRTLFFRIGGKRRWFVRARRNLAYVWQYGRFSDDLQFWKNALGDEARVEPIAGGKGMRFFLTSSDQFNSFEDAAVRKLASADWLHASDNAGDEADDDT